MTPTSEQSASVGEFRAVDSSSDTEQLLHMLETREAFTPFVALRRRVCDHLEVSAGDRVLEAGCGTGGLLTDLLERGAHATGVDASERAIARARSRFPGADLRVASAEHLPFGGKEFLGYAAVLLYDHLVDPRPALAEAHRVLQPGGRLVLVSIDNDAWLVDSDTPTILRRILPAWADSVANTWMGRRSRSLLLEAGFADVFVEMRAGVFTSYDEIGGALDGMARIATASGALSREEAETWRTEQRRRGEVDRLFVACPFVYTWARRP